MSYFLDGEFPFIKILETLGVLLIFSVSLVTLNLSLELLENQIFALVPSHFHLEFSVRKPNCLNYETFENRGLTAAF